ncbi:MAG: tetratricopeptide repeat protein, partial [Candidatus Omnitrophica bacterium]|nr:tetratricopeptide repeat protein [Candidatus Omnitrophota bacterium]
MTRPMITKKLIGFHLLVLCLLIVCAFFNAQHGSFKMDDHDTFKDPKIINPSYLKYNWIPEPNRYLKVSVASEESSYRPVTNSILAIMYQSFKNQTVYYHVISLLLLIMASSFFYGLMVLLSKEGTLAFLSAALFALHPINGLAVNYVVAYAYVLQFAVAMICMFSFARSLDSNRPQVTIGVSIVFYLMAMGVHETSMVLPIYLFCMAWLVGRKNFLQSFLRTLPFFVILTSYLVFRLHYASLKSGVLEKFSDFHMSVVQFLATYVKLVAWYLSQLFFPDGVVLMWACQIVEDHIYLWLLLGIALIAVGLIGLIKFGRSLYSWAIVIFAVGFVPIMGACLFRPTTGLVMEPHWMFIAGTGFFILLAEALRQVIAYKQWIGIILIAFLMTGYIRLTHLYNELWRDEKTYCLYWLAKVPSFKTTEFYLAYAFMLDKQYGHARHYLNSAKEGVFNDWQIYANLGFMDSEEGRYDGAVENYKTALVFNPNAAEVYNNLALVYEEMGKLQEAVRSNQEALSLNRMLVEPRLNLARIALVNHDFKTAEKLYQENLTIFPQESRSLQLFLMAILDSGDIARAE